MKDKTTRETFNDDEAERLLRGYLPRALFDAGLYCRADDREDPVIKNRAAAHHRAAGVRRHRVAPAVGAQGRREAPLAGDHAAAVATPLRPLWWEGEFPPTRLPR